MRVYLAVVAKRVKIFLSKRKRCLHILMKYVILSVEVGDIHYVAVRRT